jgi:integrase
MGSVAKRPDGRWRARYRSADGKEHARHFDRKIEADRFLTEQQNKVNHGEWVDPALGRMTVGEWSATWIASKQSLKPRARRSYAEVYSNLVEPRWATTPLSKVTYSDVVVWLAELAGRGLSASRQRHGLLVMKQLLDLAVLDGRIARNVAKPVRPARVIRSEPRFLTHEQLARLASECGDYETFVLFLGYTGLRWGEARALQVRHLDLMRARVDVTMNLPDGSSETEVVAPKSHRRRTVPVPRFLVDELATLIAGKAAGDLVFTNSRGGMLSNSNFRRNVFDPAVRALGYQPLTPHNMRDTAASLAVSAGGNVLVVQRMLGHASAAMTLDIYSGLFADDLDDVAAKVNDAAMEARRLLAEKAASAPIGDLRSARAER